MPIQGRTSQLETYPKSALFTIHLKEETLLISFSHPQENQRIASYSFDDFLHLSKIDKIESFNNHLIDFFVTEGSP